MYKYKNRELDSSKPVKVYRNLHNNLLSVMQDNLVVAHAEELHLKDVSFHVQKAGQKKCRETRSKTVHAYAKGFINPEQAFYEKHNRISYNPYKNDGFTNSNGEEVIFISGLYLTSDGLMVHS